MALNENAININAGFELGSAQPIDSRQYLTKAQMLSINDNIMPDVYMAVCKNDGCIYTYNKNNEVDLETGKFRIVNADSIKLQYTVMPNITEDNKNDVIQYIGDDETEYVKGGWYCVDTITLHSYSNGTATVYLKDSLPSTSSKVYNSDGEEIELEIDTADADNFSFTTSNGDTYAIIDNNKNLYSWKLLSGEEFDDVIKSLNYTNGKIWYGSLEEYEALDELIKRNNSITFLIYDDDLNLSLIDDSTVGHDTTLSSAEIYSKFVMASTAALVNYYKKSETLNKAEILAMIGQTLTTKIVSVLPTESISENTIYLLSNASDSYDQYMYISNSWIKIGTTDLDMEGYATTEQLEEKQGKLTFDNVPTENSENPVTSNGIYQGLSSKLTVVDSMPLIPTTSAVLLYVGESGTYEQGGIYKWDTDRSIWQLISMAEIDLTPYKKTFIGTKAEWNGLSSEEKANYDIANLTDDTLGGDLVISDTPTIGEMNPITSNAVASACSEITSGTGTRNTEYVGDNDFIAKWYKCGKICFVEIQFNTIKNTNSEEQIITGFPKPKTGVAIVCQGNSNTATTSVVLTRSGYIRTHYTTTAGTFGHVSFSYITED